MDFTSLAIKRVTCAHQMGATTFAPERRRLKCDPGRRDRWQKMLLSMGSLVGRKVFGGNVKTVAGGVGVQGKMHSGRSPTDAEKYDVGG
nr:hypothetical protein Iba_chr11bCG17370 [Ipomoea batatas]